MKGRIVSCILCLAVFALAAPAWAAKVKVCHVPPGDPANFHTITVSENALQAHLGHGDLPGACFEHCDQLCDDGDACTIDACDAAEQCLVTHPPVSCDDGNLCTIDSCDPANGCASTPKVCQDGALCTVDSCDPMTGNCAFPPISCPTGQECNAGNGSCESAASCPCVEQITGFATILEHPDFNLCYQLDQEEGSAVFLGILGVPVISAGVDAVAGTGSCGSLFAHLEITPQEAEQCMALLLQAANEAGVTCVPPPGPTD